MILGPLPIRIFYGDSCLFVDWDIVDGFAYPVLRADGPIVLSDSNLEKLRRALDRVESEARQTNEKIEEEELCLYEDRSDEFIPEGF